MAANHQDNSRKIEIKRHESLKNEPTSVFNQRFNTVNASDTQTARHNNNLPVLEKAKEDALIKFNHITYLLYAVSFFSAGLLWIVPIVMNYLRRGEAEGTWLATHFDWQIKTFWYSLILGIIGATLLFMSLGGLGISIFAESSEVAIGSIVMAIIGGLIFVAAILWHLYRIVRGWIALTDNRPVQ